MDDRQKAYDLHLQKMRKELEGAEAAAEKRVAEAESKATLLNHKLKVSTPSQSICACKQLGLDVHASDFANIVYFGIMATTDEPRYGIGGE